jgi:hypothetical protein
VASDFLSVQSVILNFTILTQNCPVKIEKKRAKPLSY